MGTAYQPKIVTDGLAFIYDTGSGKSYKGEPTTNVNTLTLSDSGTDGSGQSSVGTRTVITDNHVRIVDVSSNTRQSHLITGLTASTTYTISIMYKKLDGTPTFRFQIQDYSGAAYLRTIKFTNTTEIGIEDREGWQQASWTFTLGSDANAVRIWYQDGADYTTYTHSFELQNPQLEAKSHATPYVDGTRSATQGLLDLTNNATIDISDVSFDSDAQMTFDGTDDQLIVDNIGIDNYSESFSYECVFKAEGTWANGFISNIVGIAGSYAGHYGLGKSGTNTVNFVVRDANYNSVSGPVSDTSTYHHLVGVWDQSNSQIRLYIDGELKSSASVTKTGTPDSNDLRIGGRAAFGGNNGSYYHGNIPIVKYYKTALTTAEVLQNFNASRDRFKI